MARVELHEENLELIDTEPAVRDILEAIAADARRNVRRGRTLGLAEGISVVDVTRNGGRVESTARNPRSSPEHAAYPRWVEKGTRRSRAFPYLRPAALKYRT